MLLNTISRYFCRIQAKTIRALYVLTRFCDKIKAQEIQTGFFLLLYNVKKIININIWILHKWLSVAEKTFKKIISSQLLVVF